MLEHKAGATKGDKIQVLNVATRSGIIKGIRVVTGIAYNGNITIRAHGYNDFQLKDNEWELIEN